jgi:hypothetical protein
MQFTNVDPFADLKFDGLNKLTKIFNYFLFTVIIANFETRNVVDPSSSKKDLAHPFEEFDKIGQNSKELNKKRNFKSNCFVLVKKPTKPGIMKCG